MEKAPGCGDQRHSLLKMALMFRLQACSLIPLYSLFPSVPASGDSKLSCRLTAPSRLNVRQGKAYHLKHIDHGAGGLLRHPQGYDIELFPLEMNRDHSVIFEIASKYCILDSFVDHDGYFISSKGFLPTVVDIMVI